MAPPFLASAPNTTRWGGGVEAWSKSEGTTWHSEQAIGGMRAEAAEGFRWPRWAPTKEAEAPVVVAGGEDLRFMSVPASVPTRAPSPWQSTQPSAAMSARAFMWKPAWTTRPAGSMVWGWQALQDAADDPVTGGWPVGGMAWHEAHAIRVVSVQSIVVVDPVILWVVDPVIGKEKLPWQ